MALLDPYQGTFTEAEAAHLARRAGLGATPSQITQLASLGMSAAVDSIVDYAPHDATYEALLASLPDDTAVDLGKVKHPATQAQNEGAWLHRLVHSTQPFQEQYTLLLHDTLVSEYVKTRSNIDFAVTYGNDGSQSGQRCTTGTLAPDPNRQTAFAIRLLRAQHDTFRTAGHLSYKELVRTITRDPAMLLYLDNYTNTKTKPQENYGREVLELFSMGVGNYTETDVKENSRALTGEGVNADCASDYPYTYRMTVANHDTNSKTLLGTTFNSPTPGQDADTAIDIIFNKISGVTSISPAHATYPAASLYIGWKFLTWFLLDSMPITDPAVAEIAATFNSTSPNGYNYDVRETLRKLLKSQLFYDPQYRFRIYKHPVDFLAMAMRNLGLEETSYSSSGPSALRAMGMQLFQPPNVAGWDHGQTWINSSAIIGRFNSADRLSSSSSIMTDAWVDNLITSGAVTGNSDNAGILEFFRARLIQDPLRPEEITQFNSFYASIDGASTSTSKFRRKVRGTVHLIMALPKYQLK